MVPPGIATATLSTQPYRLGNSAQVCLYLCIQMPKKAELSTQPYRLAQLEQVCLYLCTQPLLNGKNAKMVPPGIAAATLSTQPYRLAQVEQVCLYLCTHMPKNAKLSTQPSRPGFTHNSCPKFQANQVLVQIQIKTLHRYKSRPPRYCKDSTVQSP